MCLPFMMPGFLDVLFSIRIQKGLEFANAGKVYIGSFYRPPKYTSAGFEPVHLITVKQI